MNYGVREVWVCRWVCRYEGKNFTLARNYTIYVPFKYPVLFLLTLHSKYSYESTVTYSGTHYLEEPIKGLL